MIVAVNGEAVGSTDELVSKLRSLAPDETVTLAVRRNGGLIELTATLGDRASA